MAKTITSRPSIFGWTNHYDEHGKKIGESRPSIFGGVNHYDASGKKVGHSYPGIISDEVHYDNHGHRVGHSMTGITGYKNHYDEGISGTSTRKREGFQSMVADALAGKIGLILTKSVSRFARNTVDSLTTIRELKAHGTEVYFEKENIWTFDSKGELLISIMSSLAQEESRSISLNVTWGWHKRFADGKPVVPFSHFLGYDRGENGELVINEEEADTVRIICAEFQAGLSFTQIAKELTDLGIKSPAGKDVWNSGTVKSILMNEKYKGCALLQKGYTEDYLTKKRVKNDGAIPQYYVEESHPYIIEPEVFDRVQDLIELRKKHKHFSGSTIFSTKIRCGCCGEWYGSKVWHSTDRYRRVIWRCNAKYDDKEHRCSTPHLTEEEVKAAFIRAVNKLAADREWLLADLREIQATYSGTDERDQRLRELDERLNAEADAVQELIAENARVAQNQDDYNRRYDEAVSRFETTNLHSRLNYNVEMLPTVENQRFSPIFCLHLSSNHVIIITCF